MWTGGFECPVLCFNPQPTAGVWTQTESSTIRRVAVAAHCVSAVLCMVEEFSFFSCFVLCGVVLFLTNSTNVSGVRIACERSVPRGLSYMCTHSPSLPSRSICSHKIRSQLVKSCFFARYVTWS